MIWNRTQQWLVLRLGLGVDPQDTICHSMNRYYLFRFIHNIHHNSFTLQSSLSLDGGTCFGCICVNSLNNLFPVATNYEATTTCHHQPHFSSTWQLLYGF